MDIQKSVRDRYGEGAKAREAALCCPVAYDPRYLVVKIRRKNPRNLAENRAPRGGMRVPYV
jgi:hypothetical protein